MNLKSKMLPASFADESSLEVTREAKESCRRHVLLKRSHTYNNPLFVTSSNFQHSSQSIKAAADPIIMAGIARLPHFV